MNHVKAIVPRAVSAFVVVVLLNGCGSDASSLDEIPRYPGATQTEAMQQSGMLGIMSGELVQLETRDDYDQVLSFYTERLADAELMLETTEQGRVAALTIAQPLGAVSVAIQEFDQENAVYITLMRVGG